MGASAAILTRIAVSLIALVATACSAGTVAPSASASRPPVATASPSVSPTVNPTAPASAPAADQLTGDWGTGVTTCAEQNAAVEAAGFTAEEMTLGGWSPTCSHGMPHGSQFIIRFSAGRLIIFQDGDVGWGGLYRIVDDQTFEAGGTGNAYYITYDFAIDGDQLTVDMTKDDCPYCTTPAELAGEQIAQTVIYETAPFTRQH